MSENHISVCEHGRLRRSCEVCDLADQCDQLERERDELREALAARRKQMGVACMKHDLTHSLACGHCYAELTQVLREAMNDLKHANARSAKARIAYALQRAGG